MDEDIQQLILGLIGWLIIIYFILIYGLVFDLSVNVA